MMMLRIVRYATAVRWFIVVQLLGAMTSPSRAFSHNSITRSSLPVQPLGIGPDRADLLMPILKVHVPVLRAGIASGASLFSSGRMSAVPPTCQDEEQPDEVAFFDGFMENILAKVNEREALDAKPDTSPMPMIHIFTVHLYSIWVALGLRILELLGLGSVTFLLKTALQAASMIQAYVIAFATGSSLHDKPMQLADLQDSTACSLDQEDERMIVSQLTKVAILKASESPRCKWERRATAMLSDSAESPVPKLSSGHEVLAQHMSTTTDSSQAREELVKMAPEIALLAALHARKAAQHGLKVFSKAAKQVVARAEDALEAHNKATSRVLDEPQSLLHRHRRCFLSSGAVTALWNLSPRGQHK